MKLKDHARMHVATFDVSGIDTTSEFWDEDDTRSKDPYWCVHECRSLILRWNWKQRHENATIQPIVERLESNFCGRAIRVFLADLPAGGKIPRHSDEGSQLVDKVNRLTMAITTNPDVHFIIGDIRYVFAPGECYEINNLMHHEVYNRGSTSRIHLIVDVLNEDNSIR